MNPLIENRQYLIGYTYDFIIKLAYCNLFVGIPAQGPNLQNFVKCTYENVTKELRIVS